MTNIYITNCTQNCTLLNLDTNTNLLTSTIGTLNGSSLNSTNLNVSSGTVQNALCNSITMSNLVVSASTISNILLTGSSTFTNLNVTNITCSQLNATNYTQSTTSLTNITVTNLNVNSSGFSTNPTISSFSAQGSIAGTTSGSISWIKYNSLLSVSGFLKGTSCATSGLVIKFRLTLPSGYTHTLSTNVNVPGSVAGSQGIALSGIAIATSPSGSSSVDLALAYQANYSGATVIFFYNFFIPVN
jgi:hypothetical protein